MMGPVTYLVPGLGQGEAPGAELGPVQHLEGAALPRLPLGPLLPVSACLARGAIQTNWALQQIQIQNLTQMIK